MRFLVDAQLPPALARWLTAQGQNAEHVIDCRLAAAPDTAIWDHALWTGAVIITKDQDFARRKVLSADGPAVVWLRLRNTRRVELIAWFDQMLPAVLSALERGETLIEVV